MGLFWSLACRGEKASLGDRGLGEPSRALVSKVVGLTEYTCEGAL